MLCLDNDNKIKMRLNIKRHREKLLQYLENTNDTVLKPKIELISNKKEKSNFNHNVKTKTKSSITVKQLQPNVKVNIQEEPFSNVGLKLEPLANIKIKDPETSPFILKKLKEQLIDEEDSSSSEEIDDDVSVGCNDDWNEINQTINENNKSNSRITKGVKYDGYKQLASEKSEEEYMYDRCDSDNPVLDKNNTTIRKGKVTNLMKNKFQNDQPQKRFRTPKNRDLHNAKERACRSHLAQHFTILKNSCSYISNSKRMPSKQSILLAAKKECDLLKYYEKKMLAEKIMWREANEDLKCRIAKFHRRYTSSNGGHR